MVAALADHGIERSVLGSALWRADEAACWGLDVECFTDAKLRTVFTAWQAELDEGTGVDAMPEAVATRLRRAGQLDRAEGYAELMGLPQDADEVDAEALVELAKRRKVRGSLVEAAALAESAPLTEVEATLNQLAGASVGSAKAAQTLTASDLARAAVTRLARRADPKAMTHPGLAGMHEAAGDFPMGSLIVIGGATNAGKSSIAMAQLLGAVRRNVKVGYVSFEDSDALFGSRLLGALSGVSSFRMMSGSLTPEDMRSIEAGANRLTELETHLFSEHPIGGNENDAVSAMTRLARRGARIIAVDYLQAINGVGKYQDRRNEIRVICSRLKAAADRLGVVLVLMSQLSRPKKGEEHREPTKHDLKEAGDVENMAEAVFMAWKTPGHDGGEVVRIKLDKLKWGPTGSVFTMKRSRTAGGSLVEEL